MLHTWLCSGMSMCEFRSFWSKKCDEYRCMRISFQVGHPSNWELKRLPLQTLPTYVARKASSKATFTDTVAHQMTVPILWRIYSTYWIRAASSWTPFL